MNLTSDSDLADILGISLPKLHELRKRHGWPHVRVDRFTFRFTDEQIAEIVASRTVKGAKALKGTAAGLTERSARRSA